MMSATHPVSDISNATATASQLSALLHRTGISSLDHTSWIQVTGNDRVRWLNGMATNAIQQLGNGAGTYNFFLNAQGRIQGDGYIFTQSETLLIETQASQVATLIPYLDHYIIMDDVELKDLTGTRSGLTIIGPQAAALLAQRGISVTDINLLELRDLTRNNARLTVIHAHSPLVPRYEIWADRDTIDALLQSLQTAGATTVASEALESLRILEGTPRYGIDIRNSETVRDLPQETNQTRALHFSKGCYLGQEIVERIRSRGNVHRTFQAFRLEGPLPAAGALLETAGKQVGELTSVAEVPLDSAPTRLALGYIRCEALDRGGTITYPGGTAVPVPSPFHPGEANSPAPASESSERK